MLLLRRVNIQLFTLARSKFRTHSHSLSKDAPSLRLSLSVWRKLTEPADKDADHRRAQKPSPDFRVEFIIRELHDLIGHSKLLTKHDSIIIARLIRHPPVYLCSQEPWEPWELTLKITWDRSWTSTTVCLSSASKYLNEPSEIYPPGPFCEMCCSLGHSEDDFINMVKCYVW